MDIYEQLIRDEGNIPHAYQDHLGYWTIGVGHLIDERKGGSISAKVRFILLQDDVSNKTLDITTRLPWAEALNPARFAVLQHMAFMTGIGGLLKFVNTLRAIRDGKYSEAAERLLDSEMARDQRRLMDLSKDPSRKTRCERLAQQLETGNWV